MSTSLTLNLEIRPSDTISEKLLGDFVALAASRGKKPEELLAELIEAKVNETSKPSA